MMERDEVFTPFCWGFPLLVGDMRRLLAIVGFLLA
jgi:hypothetical protein